MLTDGRRQIISLLLPGDLIGSWRSFQPLARATTMSLTQIITADASELISQSARAECPELEAAMTAAANLEQESLLNHIMRLGRLSAYERMAHLLLELNGRLELVNLASDGRFHLPLSQEVLADLLGLSVVHVNRILQQLRREQAITASNGQVQLLQRERLATICTYE